MSDLQKIYRNGDWVLYRDYKALADRIEELENALREYMEHDADYARLNALGDHTQSHRHTRATAALQKGKADE
jgi:hypothetical protein